MALSSDFHLLIWVSAAVLLLTLLAFFIFPLLSDYIRKWIIMKPIPGISPCYPIIGNALDLKPNGGDFFLQIIQYTEEKRSEPLIKIWVGPVPFLILYHAETVEVSISTHTSVCRTFYWNKYNCLAVIHTVKCLVCTILTVKVG
ncbi:hypothetical protein FKM82_021174, partial [Ascaphus truei]